MGIISLSFLHDGSAGLTSVCLHVVCLSVTGRTGGKFEEAAVRAQAGAFLGTGYTALSESVTEHRSLGKA